MRIVYDDEQLPLLVEAISRLIAEAFTTEIQMRSVTEWSYGMNRVEVPLVKKNLNRWIEEHGFEIGKDVHHEHGIGNNNRYPVYFNTPNEKQQVGYLNLNSDMYGGVYVYVTDYNQKKHGLSYKLSKYGHTVSR